MTTDKAGGRPPAPKRADGGAPNPYGWWFADCPRHGRTPHVAVLGGSCEKCAAERRARCDPKRTRQ